MTVKQILNPDLYDRLRDADVVCHDCGDKYGSYSVGCSSVWEGTCGVCFQKKPVTEVRDWGYLTKGISALEKGEDLKDDVRAYEQGEITLKLTEEEVGFLNECPDTIQDFHPTLSPGSGVLAQEVPLFESIEKKITELYEDNCVKYELTPACAAYMKKYGEAPMDDDKWILFKDAFEAGFSCGKENP